MELTIVGSGTGIPSARRGSPSVLVRTELCTVLIDAGPGTLRQLARLSIELRDIDVILFTHLHPDHTLDFPALCFALRIPGVPSPEYPIRVFAPTGFTLLQESIQKGYGNHTRAPDGKIDISELEIENGEIRIHNSLNVHYTPMLHSPTSLGYRIKETGGSCIACTGDTEPCDGAIAIGRDVDALLAECSFPDGHSAKGHLTPSLAGRIAREARAKSLILTHLYPECEGADMLGPCGGEYSGPTVIAEDFMTFKDLPFTIQQAG